MTYKEAYMQCNTLEELEKAVKHDLFVAKFMGSSDRVQMIVKTAEEVANLKFKGEQL